MKRTKIILLVTAVGVLCLITGAVVGVSVGITCHVKSKVRPFIETTTIEASYQLSTKGMYLKGLQNGHIENVMKALSVEIQSGLVNGPLVEMKELSDTVRKVVENNRLDSKQVLKDYQDFMKRENK